MITPLSPAPALIAIVRGLRPDEAEAIGAAVLAGGFSAIEVPLNSPDPFASIAILRRTLPAEHPVGAGTVLHPDQVHQARQAGADFIVSPNVSRPVIEATRALGMASLPGAATPTEAFAALDAGATMLKLFPAAALGPASLSAWRAVLPAGTPVLPVGGVSVQNLEQWHRAGAAGVGIGGELFHPGDDPASVGERAAAFAHRWAELSAPAG